MRPIDITIKFSRIEKITPQNWSYDPNTLTWTWQDKTGIITANEALWVYDINGTGYYFQLINQPDCELSYQLIANGNLVYVRGNVPNSNIPVHDNL